jgi:hypothetical protein
MTQEMSNHPAPAARLQRLGGRLMVLLLGAAVALGAGRAQTAAENDAIDPPGRVGSITLLAGPVTMVDLQTGSREDAVLNWPVTGGWRIETGRAARAEVRIGSTALRLDDDSTVDFVRLDDQFMQIAVLRGSAALRLRNPEILRELEVLTQRERIAFDDVGSYRVDVDRIAGQTAITVFAGRARVGVNGSSFVIARGQRGEVNAAPMVRFQLATAAADRFDDWVATRDARDDAIRSESYVSRETTGMEALDEYGEWRSVLDYGPVWFPRAVSPTWAPYRYGRWAWVDPWGWTWVDEAPWGFAPFHYGRWVVVGGLWGWVPGVIVARPVYAPALVAWYGTPAVTVGIGAPIGWFPLGPREVYKPAFRHSPRYLKVVNVQHVPNVERVTVVQTPRYVHHHPDRSTWVPGDRFGRPEPVQRGQRPPPSEWRQYIARPQPPANVPNTKRRQAGNGTATAPGARVPAAAADELRPLPRLPVAPPGAAERPRTVETPRGVELPRARPVTPNEAPPATRAEPRGGRGESPAVIGDDRRGAPRAPPPQGRPPAPSFQPTPPAPRQAPPAVESKAPRGRGELGAMPRDAQRPAPRPSPQPPAESPAQTAAPATAPAPPSAAPAREPARPQSSPAPAERGDLRSADRPTGRSPQNVFR